MFLVYKSVTDHHCHSFKPKDSIAVIEIIMTSAFQITCISPKSERAVPVEFCSADLKLFSVLWTKGS